MVYFIKSPPRIGMSKDLKKLLREDPETAALFNAISHGARWGNAVYRIEQEKKERETSAERRVREAKEKSAREEFEAFMKKADLELEGKKAASKKVDEEEAKKMNVAKKKSRHVNKASGTLKKIAKMCKWQCTGEQCWAHNQKVCPYIHRGEPGWNESHSVKKPKRGGASRRTRKNRKN
jgi:hypothetical protein